MNRYAPDRSSGHYGPKVERAELDTRNIRLRVAVLIVFFVVAVSALTYGITHLVRAESGWQEITVSTDKANLGGEFSLFYEIGQNARIEKNTVTEVYTEACVTAWNIFNRDVHTDGAVSLYDLNHAPNTDFTVDAVLYSALERMDSANTRYLYYGPIFEMMGNLCTATNDADASSCDPEYDADTAAYFADVLSFANDPGSISIQLLGENKVRLHVSDEYLAFAAEEGIENYIDLYAMRNAFACDYIADRLTADGLTSGTLVSLEGYTRCLNAGETEFSICDRVGNTVYTAATAVVSGMKSIVTLRDFALSSGESDRYYVYANGEVRTPWIDEKGACTHALKALTGCSEDLGCAELLLNLLEMYQTGVSNRQEGVHAVYCEDRKIVSDIPGMVLKNLYNKNGVAYQKAAS